MKEVLPELFNKRNIVLDKQQKKTCIQQPCQGTDAVILHPQPGIRAEIMFRQCYGYVDTKCTTYFIADRELPTRLFEV